MRLRITRHHWYRRMTARDAHEPHRAATTLELFFDLCFVVAIALAAAQVHHEIIEGHVWDGVQAYALVFFAIWWAWMNFTWFASAYDTDDAVYRVMTFVQMSGALVLAAGVPRAFDGADIGLMTAGYVVMRLALVGQWLRAANADSGHRQTALRYAIGVSVVQALWVARLALPDDWAIPSILVLIGCELLVPVWAERVTPTTWHPHHITERYGLFTIIVLGESILAATTALQVAFDSGETNATLVSIAISGLVIVFAMWWLYFDVESNRMLNSMRGAFVYGYGHLPIFAAAAAVGAGVQVIVEHETGQGEIGSLTASLALAVPVALYILGVWVLRILPNVSGPICFAYPVAAVLVVGAAFSGVTVPAVAVVLAGFVGFLIVEEHEHRSVEPEPHSHHQTSA